MGQTNTARLRLVTALTTAGVTVVSDARDARPLSAIIDPPNITRSSTNQWSLSFPVNVVMPPPGNLDALIALLDVVDVVYNTSGY